jgi:hypothetical protein
MAGMARTAPRVSRAATPGAGVDPVVHHRDTAVGHVAAERAALGAARVPARYAGQRGADGVAGRQQFGERRQVRAQAARVGEQAGKNEPEVSVVARDVREVALVGRDEV